jgi:hypothetical protein
MTDINNWKHLEPIYHDRYDINLVQTHIQKHKIRRHTSYNNQGFQIETAPHNNKDVCNNCGKLGHIFRHCKNPIVSYGCIQFRIKNNIREYLMICRKDTLGYIDFIRGKYILQDDAYITNMFKQMTDIEKKNIMELDFDTLWMNLWQNTLSSTSLYKSEEETSRHKFNKIKGERIQLIINNSNKSGTWDVPEWGFPKGRRNYLEDEYDCVLLSGMNIDTIFSRQVMSEKLLVQMQNEIV